MKVAAAPARDRADLPFRTFPRWVLAALADAKLCVEERSEGWMVVSAGGDNLVRIRVRPDQESEAQAAGNSPFGHSDAYRRAAPQVRLRVDRALEAFAADGRSAPLIGALKQAAGDLRGAAKRRAPSTISSKRGRRRKASPYIRVVSGGLPSLGKR